MAPRESDQAITMMRLSGAELEVTDYAAHVKPDGSLLLSFAVGKAFSVHFTARPGEWTRASAN